MARRMTRLLAEMSKIGHICTRKYTHIDTHATCTHTDTMYPPVRHLADHLATGWTTWLVHPSSGLRTSGTHLGLYLGNPYANGDPVSAII